MYVNVVVPLSVKGLTWNLIHYIVLSTYCNRVLHTVRSAYKNQFGTLVLILICGWPSYVDYICGAYLGWGQITYKLYFNRTWFFHVYFHSHMYLKNDVLLTEKKLAVVNWVINLLPRPASRRSRLLSSAAAPLSVVGWPVQQRDGTVFVRILLVARFWRLRKWRLQVVMWGHRNCDNYMFLSFLFEALTIWQQFVRQVIDKIPSMGPFPLLILLKMSRLQQSACWLKGTGAPCHWSWVRARPASPSGV